MMLVQRVALGSERIDPAHPCSPARGAGCRLDNPTMQLGGFHVVLVGKLLEMFFRSFREVD